MSEDPNDLKDPAQSDQNQRNVGLLGRLLLALEPRNWRVGVLVSAIIAMLVTPTTDPGSMAIVMALLTAVYFLAMALRRWYKKIDAGW